MSGPYDSYGGHQGGYNQNYNQSYSQDQYGQQQPGYGQQQPNYHGQQQYGGYQDQGFAPPARQDSFGPPQHGGFQHGQQGGQYGTYDASNPQGHEQYYGSQQHQSYDQNAQYQQYQQSGQQALDEQALQNHQFAPQSSDRDAPNYDPNAPPMNETDRGLLGSLGGGVAGHFLGKKAGHGFLGTIGGALMGNIAQDLFKDKKKHHGSSGGSSWGGSGRY